MMSVGYREKIKPARLNAIRTGTKVNISHVCPFTFVIVASHISRLAQHYLILCFLNKGTYILNSFGFTNDYFTARHKR